MEKLRIGVLVFIAAMLVALGAPVRAQADDAIRARLRGFEEVPAVSTTGTGEFRARISNDGRSIEYQLTYTLEGSVQRAHIHLGQKDVNGGIVLWLCTNIAEVPASLPTPPACPPSPGVVTGTLMASNVNAVPSQGISFGDFAEVLRAIRRGVTYANVHSTPNHPGGEIRGQIKHRGEDSDDE